MARPKSIRYRSVTTKRFWEMVTDGYEPGHYCFLIMDDGTQSWGYPMRWGKFDHHKQGGIHKQDKIAYVMISEADFKQFNK